MAHRLVFYTKWGGFDIEVFAVPRNFKQIVGELPPILPNIAK